MPSFDVVSKVDLMELDNALHTAQNDVYDHLVTIQNAGNLEFPASNPANAQARAKLLLGTFPPKDTGGKGKQPPTPPTPPTP